MVRRSKRADPYTQKYGNRAETERLRQELPQGPQTGVLPQGPGTPPVQPGLAAPPPGPAERFQAAEQAAQLAPNIGEGLLAGPSRRPDEPVTAGLSVGPGPGPEALAYTRAQTGRVTAVLQRLAQSTNQPALQALADVAAQQRL